MELQANHPGLFGIPYCFFELPALHSCRLNQLPSISWLEVSVSSSHMVSSFSLPWRLAIWLSLASPPLNIIHRVTIEEFFLRTKLHYDISLDWTTKDEHDQAEQSSR